MDVWVRRPDDVPDGRGILDEHELDRLAAIVVPHTARTYAAAHALARRAVAEVVGCRAAELRFDRTCATCGQPHGRPTLPDYPTVHVSLSRGEGIVAVAVAALPVGVDAESAGATDFAGFADVALHPSERQRVEGPDLGRSLRRAGAWTRKEASLKALGIGLRTDPAHLPAPPSGIPTDLDGHGSWVTVRGVPVPWPDVAVAVAIAGRAATIDLRMR